MVYIYIYIQKLNVFIVAIFAMCHYIYRCKQPQDCIQFVELILYGLAKVYIGRTYAAIAIIFASIDNPKCLRYVSTVVGDTNIKYIYG